MKTVYWLFGALVILQLCYCTGNPAHKTDTSACTIQFMTVDKDVKLEVLDWGGAGRAVVLLAGLGADAHEFDKFAPKLVAAGHHVYGITRRGFGKSSAPSSGYSAYRLGDDILAVINALKLDRPVLVGHSIAGGELSSVGSRYPEKVSGLIYLDAAYRYAFYDPENGDYFLDSMELRERLENKNSDNEPWDVETAIENLEAIQALLPVFEKSLRRNIETMKAIRRDHVKTVTELPPITQAIFDGQKKFTKINVPILAIYAIPKDPWVSEAATLSTAFERCYPSARVVRLYNADHFVYRSNEQDVLREMNSFVGDLQ